MTTHTPQQEAFFETARARGSFSLSAVAGSGKTYSLRQWAKQARGTGIATSFSKATCSELGKTMPSKFRSATMHSIGRQALVNAGQWQSLDKGKIYSIVSSLDIEDKNNFSTVMKLAAAAKTFGMFPDLSPGNPHPRTLVPFTYENLEEIADHFSLDFNETIHSHVVDCVTQSVAQSNEGIHDFDDMLYMPLLNKLQTTTAGIVIVDEAQDLSSIQHELLSNMVMRGGRVICAGDPHQAIYGFRGALSDSFSVLSRRFDATMMPLTVSFRCPKAVVELAQLYVPEIQSAPSAPDGSVHYHEEFLATDLQPITLCRNNSPLVQMALHLIAQGYTAEVLGRDIGKGLISLTKRISKKNLPSLEFIARLNTWAEKEIKRKPRSRGRVRDKVETLGAIAATQRDMAGIQAHLDKLYPDQSSSSYRKAQYTFSTIHRAKGLEWPSVGILDFHLIPSVYAEQDWELQQEHNLAYVAVTRAQSALHFYSSDLRR